MYAVSDLAKNPGLYDELEQLWYEINRCPILLQSGKRKEKVCGKKCQEGKKTCSSHVSLHMCSNEECFRKCKEDETLCEYHQAQEKRTEEENRVYPSLRWEDPFYLIKGTSIIVDVSYNVIRGYKKELKCIPEETPEIKTACTTYQLRFVPLHVEPLDS